MFLKSFVLSALAFSFAKGWSDTIEPDGDASKPFCIMHNPTGHYLNAVTEDDGTPKGKKVLKLLRKEDSKIDDSEW